MSRDWPNVDEIFSTVDEFLANITGGLDERGRYDALCARYLLDVGRRELGRGAELDAQELQALEAFTGESGTLDQLYETLAQSIRTGAYDTQWQEVSDLIFDHVVNNVGVSRPDQLEARHRRDVLVPNNKVG